MALGHILEQAKKTVVPSKAEEQKVSEIIDEITKKVNSQLRKKKLDAKLIIGGSVAKGTWLPGISDIDFFLAFNYDEFSDRSTELSDFAEKLLKDIFKVQRLHGSRDYFSATYQGFSIEIVPVLEIKKLNQAKNITDFSPLHVNWIAKKIKKNRELQTHARLAKQFFKASGVYGAESYVGGLSGHVVEILTINYGGFLQLVRAVARWQENQVIDVEKYYKNAAEVFEKLNPSKLQSPLIIVDPIEKYRNAAAALGEEKFFLAKNTCMKFLAKPSLRFFEEKKISVSDLEKKKNNFRLIVIEAKPERGKPDVIGAKLLKKFESLGNVLAENDFIEQDSGWWWPEHGSALYWFYFDKKSLPSTKDHPGPPVKLEKFAKDFKKKWKNIKVREGKLVAVVKRKYTKPEDLLKTMVKRDKNMKILKVR